MQLSKMHLKFALLMSCLCFVSTFANDLKNVTNYIGENDDENEEIFSALLESWTLTNRNLPSRGREARVIPLESNIQTVEAPQFGGYHHAPQQSYQKYIPTSSMYLANKRVGVADDVELDPNRRHPSDESIISRIQQPPPPQVRPYNSPREVSETDLYLLGAIEKLAFRVDYLEKRLKRTEQIVYYLMSGNNQNQPQLAEPSPSTTTQSPTTTKKPVRDSCPKDFRKIGDVCYHLSSSERVDWKSAALTCRSYGAILAEFDKVEKFRDVVANILSHKTHRGHDYWIGGLNPGLLWIWSTSARPVNPNTNLTSFSGGNKKDVVNKIPVKVLNQANQQNKTTTATPSTISANFPDIIGDGRCLRLSYNPTIFSYGYTGHDCGAKQHYLCMIVDKTLDNEIKRIAKELNLQI